MYVNKQQVTANELRMAVLTMAQRYADATADFALGTDLCGGRALTSEMRSRAVSRRHGALLRLTRALANMAA